MNEFENMYRRMLAAFEDSSVRIPCCGLKFVRQDEPLLDDTFEASPRSIEAFPRSLASCGYSYKAAKGGLTLKVTKAGARLPGPAR